MIDKISDLISAGNYIEAAALLSEEMVKNGFNDEIAILAAGINAGMEDYANYLSMIEKGLSYNPSNYELHLMLAEYYKSIEPDTALREYELALRYSEFLMGTDHGDYAYIKNAYDGFCESHREWIRQFHNSLPIMIYKSDEICFGILNRFADIMADELRKLGEEVEIFDVNETPPEELAKYSGIRYKAILGIQTFLFSMKYNDGRNVHDYILGEKYNMVFDHPCCMYNHFTNGPKDYTILTHDRNYESFIKEHYPGIRDVKMLPPGGILGDIPNKEYDLIFVGSYKSPDTWDGVISDLDKKYDGKATKICNYMMENPNCLYEDCVDLVMGSPIDAEVYYDLKQTYFKVMSYYRERILLALLDAGVAMHVFGDSFDTEPFGSYNGLLIKHDELNLDESIEVYGKARASLNIMSWHKDGRTERVANSMLNKSLVISDESTFLKENYVDGEDIILFNLTDVKENPQNVADRIKSVVGDYELMEKMASKAYDKAVINDTWECRAREFVNLINR